MLRDFAAVFRFEVARMLGSFRALLVLLLYASATTLIGLFYVSVVRGLEEQAVEMLAKQGGAGAARGVVDITQTEAYRNLIQSITGGDSAKAEFWLATPPMVLVSFWLALAAMPWLVSFVAHDVIARDTESRTLRFVRPKTPIESWVLGKFAAHSILILTVSVLSAIELYAIGLAKLETFDATAGLIGFAQFWPRLLVYEVGFLGITFALSADARTSFSALMSGGMALFGLWILQFFSAFKDNPLSYLQYVSPFAYNTMLLNPIGVPLAEALGAYLLFAGLGLGLCIQQLKTRDV